MLQPSVDAAVDDPPAAKAASHSGSTGIIASLLYPEELGEEMHGLSSQDGSLGCCGSDGVNTLRAPLQRYVRFMSRTTYLTFFCAFNINLSLGPSGP